MSGNSQGSETSPSSRIGTSSNATANGQDHSDTQRSLQQASVALEVAYNRIRQVRRSLLQLSESLPNPEGLPRFTMNYNEVRPGHEALLLSGGGSEEQSELDADPVGLHPLMPMPPSPDLGSTTAEQSGAIRDAGDHLGANYTISRTTNSSRPSILFQPLPIPTPPAPIVRPPRVRTRRELSPSEMRSFSRGESSQESASTTRGLRVAAREAHGLDAGSGIDFLTYAAEFDRLLARQRERSADAANALSTFRAERAERQNRLLRYAETRDAQRAAPAAPPVSTLPPVSSTSWRAPDARRWRMRPDVRLQNARQYTLEASERFQTLSSMSNPTPQSQPPPSNIPRSRSPVAAGPRTTSPPLVDVTDQPHRQPLESLRSEDMSSNVNIDWSDEEFISWLFPAQDHYMLPSRDFPTLIPHRQNADTIRVTRTTDTAVSPSENSPPRRGWARLDPDGNEIPPYEEEELERSRTEYRLRALQQARQSAALQTGNGASRVIAIGGLYQDYDSDRAMHGSVLDSALRVREGRQRSAGTHGYGSDAAPFYVDPLPMPLAAMVSAPETQKESKKDVCVDIVVPKHACLAGR